MRIQCRYCGATIHISNGKISSAVSERWAGKEVTWTPKANASLNPTLPPGSGSSPPPPDPRDPRAVGVPKHFRLMLPGGPP